MAARGDVLLQSQSVGKVAAIPSSEI